MSGLNPGRHAALRVLMAVEKGAHADERLDALAPTGGSDRGLAWHIALGVQRRRGSLDQALSTRIRGGDLSRLDAPVRAALRMGLFEIWHSSTPPHAAVDQAVRGCRSVGAARASGLVNAVLRRLSGGAPVSHSELPDWLSARWGEQEAWVASLCEPSPLQGVWNGERRCELVAEALNLERGTIQLPGGTGRISDLPGFAAGDWWVMDSGSVRCADSLHDVVAPGSRLLDTCAAPGGKSMRLASLGHQVVATDASSERLEMVGEAASRLSLDVERIEHDWERGPAEGMETFDGVLVDAPCTGLGTIRRRPEIRWRVLPTDPAAMAIRQRRILHNAAMCVRPGGWLVYSVCSPMEEEGRGVADSLEGWTVATAWRNLPPHAGEDVFQCFVMQRAE